MAARAVAAGHGHRADQLVFDDLVRQVVPDEDDLEQILRQAGFKAQIAQQQPAAGADRCMFEDHRIACHQIRGEHAHRLVNGEVPRLHAVDHPDRREGHDPALATAAVPAFLVGQFLRSMVRSVFENTRADLDLGLPVLDQLAHFARHQFGEALGIGAQDLGDLAQIGRALVMRFGAPVEKRGMRRVDLREHLALAHGLIGLERFAGGGVAGLYLGHISLSRCGGSARRSAWDRRSCTPQGSARQRERPPPVPFAPATNAFTRSNVRQAGWFGARSRTGPRQASIGERVLLRWVVRSSRELTMQHIAMRVELVAEEGLEPPTRGL